MIIISITNNKFIYNNNINKCIHVNRTSETINKLIQYNLNNIYNINIIDIDFIYLLIDLNEIKLLKKITIIPSDFPVLKSNTYTGINKKYDKINLYTIFEQLYSIHIFNALYYFLIGSDENQHIYHRDNDLPAIIYDNGVKKWFKEGNLHRDNDLPAIIYSNGDKNWYKNNEFHRDNDLPAIITNNSKYWIIEGKLHRDNDLPAIIYKNGSKEWCKNNLTHRDNDLPAIIYSNGNKEWYKNGMIHRDNDLPAVIYSNGNKEWYKNGVRY
jgi:hypothetical protein